MVDRHPWLEEWLIQRDALQSEVPCNAFGACLRSVRLKVLNCLIALCEYIPEKWGGLGRQATPEPAVGQSGPTKSCEVIRPLLNDIHTVNRRITRLYVHRR